MKRIEQYILEHYSSFQINLIKLEGLKPDGWIKHVEDFDIIFNSFEDEIFEFLLKRSSELDISLCEYIATIDGQRDVANMKQFKIMLCCHVFEYCCQNCFGKFSIPYVIRAKEFYKLCQAHPDGQKYLDEFVDEFYWLSSIDDRSSPLPWGCPWFLHIIEPLRGLTIKEKAKNYWELVCTEILDLSKED